MDAVGSSGPDNITHGSPDLRKEVLQLSCDRAGVNFASLSHAVQRPGRDIDKTRCLVLAGDALIAEMKLHDLHSAIREELFSNLLEI